jgi:hypothetical protein
VGWGSILNTIGAPAAVYLVAGRGAALKTRIIAFSCLDRSDQVGFFHFAGLNSHFFCYYLNFFDSHDIILTLLLLYGIIYRLGRNCFAKYLF